MGDGTKKKFTLSKRVKERRERDEEVKRIIEGIKKLDQKCMQLAREKKRILAWTKPSEKKEIAKILNVA